MALGDLYNVTSRLLISLKQTYALFVIVITVIGCLALVVTRQFTLQIQRETTAAIRVVLSRLLFQFLFLLKMSFHTGIKPG